MSKPENSFVPGMAYRTFGASFDEKRIIIAIGFDGNDIQIIAGYFPFFPEAIFCPAPKYNLMVVHCMLKRIFIHETEHEYGVIIFMLDNNGNQPVHFFKINRVYHNRIGIPSACK